MAGVLAHTVLSQNIDQTMDRMSPAQHRASPATVCEAGRGHLAASPGLPARPRRRNSFQSTFVLRRPGTAVGRQMEGVDLDEHFEERAAEPQLHPTIRAPAPKRGGTQICKPPFGGAIQWKAMVNGTDGCRMAPI